MDFVTAPLIADLFLLAISAIGRQEVHDGTVGANGISPIDIMVFFLTLAYIAISIDASGLIRWLAFKVLEKGGRYGHRLFLYLYIFFYALTSFIGNDPVILSGTAFLAYMTRVSSNIMHPRAWIHTQFAVANIASAILVSSNPTNLVLAGAFGIKFINYTANIIVPVLVTGVVLFPFLLYIVFAHEDLIPEQILMHELTQEQKERKIVNPNIPNAGGVDEEEKNAAGGDLVEVMRPFLDKRGAGFGAVVMATTLITLLALNAASQSSHEHPVFWVTLPAATVMFCWDLWFGWNNRQETREAVEQLRKEAEETRAARARRRAEEQEAVRSATGLEKGAPVSYRQKPDQQEKDDLHRQSNENGSAGGHSELSTAVADEKLLEYDPAATPRRIDSNPRESERLQNENKQENYSSKSLEQDDVEEQSLQTRNQTSIETLIRDGYRWAQITFPTATTVFTHLPFKLVPFALAMFVLVQGLVTTGWVPVFAYGWDHWVYKTGTVGAIGGMGFVSVILCNASLSILQSFRAWQANSDFPCSLQAQTLAPPFSSRAFCKPGKKSIVSTERQLATGRSGAQSTAWL